MHALPSAEDLLIAHVDDLWVLHKPAFIPTHPGSRRVQTPDLLTLARDLLGAPDTLAPIHRLDKQTSGLVLCSANADLRAAIGEELSQHRVDKSYLAMVYGHSHTKGIVRTPLEDARRGRPLPAITRYKRLQTFGSCSLLEVRPETGRKHQIRRHLQSIRHAIVGDDLYPHHRRIKLPAFPKRLWLHAHRISIPSLELSFEAPLSQPLQAQLDLLLELRGSRDDSESP